MLCGRHVLLCSIKLALIRTLRKNQRPLINDMSWLTALYFAWSLCQRRTTVRELPIATTISTSVSYTVYTYVKYFLFSQIEFRKLVVTSRLNHKSLDFKFSFRVIVFHRICDFHIRFRNNNFINIYALSLFYILLQFQPEYSFRLSSIQFQLKATFQQSISSDQNTC